MPKVHFLAGKVCLPSEAGGRNPVPVTRFLVRWFIPAVLLFTLVMGQTPLAAAGTGPRRIVSMSPAITEILFELDVGDRLVGVTDFCNFPEAAARLPRVGGILNPNIETLVSLRPDLIIHQHDSANIRDHARRLGIPSLAVEVTHLKPIFHTIEQLGKALSRPEAADRLLRKLKKGIESYQTRLKGIPRRSVLLILGFSSDPARDLYAVGRGTFLDELLTVSGGQNILPESMVQYPKISKEFVIRQSPEIIIEVGPRESPTDGNLRPLQWRRFTTIRAVKNNRVYFIGSDYLLIPGPRLLNIVDRFARLIHPNLFPDPEVPQPIGSTAAQ